MQLTARYGRTLAIAAAAAASLEPGHRTLSDTASGIGVTDTLGG